MKMSSSAKCYQGNKERLQKTLVKDVKTFLMKKKKKRGNMVMNIKKNLSEDKKQKLAEYKSIYIMRKK